MVSEYYFACFRPMYRYGYADLGGRGNSEAQSYGMLQAYMMDDKRTFRNIWVWTKQNLQREEDKLFSWDFDLKGSFWTYPAKKAIIKDVNSATDADEDIALALLLAGRDGGSEE
jgi:endo-1,4-beta-D-glucanase Y